MVHDLTPRAAHSKHREVLHLLERIQALTLELQELRRRGEDGHKLRGKEQAREQSRWRLAFVAREAAVNAHGEAA
jgi:hypothetical protein